MLEVGGDDAFESFGRMVCGTLDIDLSLPAELRSIAAAKGTRRATYFYTLNLPGFPSARRTARYSHAHCTGVYLRVCYHGQPFRRYIKVRSALRSVFIFYGGFIMKRIFYHAVRVYISLSTLAFADEGMWLYNASSQRSSQGQIWLCT